MTPRYGTEVMGGAETAVRRLAEHLQRPHATGRPRSTRPARSTPSPGPTSFEPGTTEVQRGLGPPAPVRARPPARLLRPGRPPAPGPAQATREQGRRWVEYNGPVSPELVEAVCASDADVVAFYPYLYHPTVATIGKVSGAGGVPPGGPRRAGAVPARVPRHLRRRRRLLLLHRVGAHAGRADVPGGRATPDRARARAWGSPRASGRPGGELLRAGRPPLRRERGTGRRAQGLQDAGVVLRHLQGAPSRPAGPRPRRPGLGRAAAASRRRGDGPGGRGRQVGHRARRLGGGLALGPRIVLPGGDRGVGGAGARPRQRRLWADP